MSREPGPTSRSLSPVSSSRMFNEGARSFFAAVGFTDYNVSMWKRGIGEAG